MRFAVLLAALAPLACSPSDDGVATNGDSGTKRSAASRNWPAGTALVVGGDIPIATSEVDAYLPAIALIEPRFVEKQLQRVALTNIVLPRAVARVLAGPEAYERARLAAETARKAVDSGEWTGPLAPGTSGGTLVSGPYSEVGIARWAHCFELQPGQWSDVFEEIGAFTFVKCLRRVDGALPIQTEFELETVSFPYLPEGKGLIQVEEAYDRVELEILDPAWRTIVPELLQYRMGVHSP
ncbi:MAG: hypothetical protein L6Q99_04160 [Planctomycetes bacterium]|nr:hypothetical protein [Planctomycetota bacterium]